MGKWLKPLWAQDKTYTKLAPLNREAIRDNNEKMLSLLTRMGGLLMTLPLLTIPFSQTKAVVLPIYLLSALLFFVLAVLFRRTSMKKYTLLGLYLCFSALFLFAIYLSVIHSPEMRATVLLGACCLMPMGFTDRPIRMNLFVAFWLTVHTILAFHFKPRYALDDLVNCLCIGVLGCYLGNMMVRVRLEGYEAYRLRTIEKETDVLTGLSNRRKLYETLALLETPDAQKPTGVLMLDIDCFKEFNDSHGHAAGDKCLRHLGDALTKFTENLQVHFYRYGGEEFVAMAYGYSRDELLKMTESLRLYVQNYDMDGHFQTVSIGVAYCGDEEIRNYETVIDRADKAAYAAKRAGRNKVCTEEPPEIYAKQAL